MTRERPVTHPLRTGNIIALICVAIDQGSKLWVLNTLQVGHYHPLLGNLFGLQLIHNPGAAFSIGDGHTWIFTLIAAAVVVGALFTLPKLTNRVWLVSVAVFLGGAIGNLIDRLFQPPAFARGHVVDFLAYSTWFVGNIADIFLVVAAIMIAVLALLSVPTTAAVQRREASDG